MRLEKEVTMPRVRGAWRLGRTAHCPERGYGTPKGQEVIPWSQPEKKR